MPVESATYVSDLDVNQPVAGDPVAEGDNHLRLIKQALKTTFPTAGVNAGLVPAADLASTASGKGAALVGFIQNGTGAVPRTLLAKVREIASVADFGAVGDGVTDDTTAINAAAAASVGKTLLLDASKTYVISAITIPAGVTLAANNSVFRKVSASATPAITIQGSFIADRVVLSSPGSAADVGIRIAGRSVYIDRLVSTSDAVDSNIGIQVQSTDGTALEYIFIRSMRIVNFLSAALIFNVGYSEFNNIRIISYRLGVYLRDVYGSNFRGAHIDTMAPSATGAAGQNGLLVESTLAGSSSNNLRFDSWSVVNAAEHGYRFGGQLAIQNVWMRDCRSTLSGNAGAAATGGSGFKVLGATTVAGQRHRDFFFDNCIAEDVSTTAGQGNFAGFIIAGADNVHLTDCSVAPKSNTYSSWHGFSIEDTTETFLTNCHARACRQHGIRVTTGTYTISPGVLGVVDKTRIIGGYFDVDAASASAVLRINADGTDAAGTVDEMTLSGVVFSGGNCAVRAESGLTYTKNLFDLEYVNPGNITGGPPLQISGDAIRVNFRGLFYGTSGAQAANGSYFLDTTSGTMRMRRAGGWTIISDIDFGTYTPTVTAVTNLDSASLVGTAQYLRFGSVVTVSGVVALDPTATGSITARISLPVASNFTSLNQAAGTAQSGDATINGAITADSTNDALTITGNSTTTSVRNVSFTCTYVVA